MAGIGAAGLNSVKAQGNYSDFNPVQDFIRKYKPVRMHIHLTGL